MEPKPLKTIPNLNKTTAFHFNSVHAEDGATVWAQLLPLPLLQYLCYDSQGRFHGIPLHHLHVFLLYPSGALEDLGMALQLSKGVGRVACQAFVQRGLIQRLQGHEQEAHRDFEQAARLGSAFARRQLVLMNPYAALCNQMLSEMIKKLRGPSKEPQTEASSGEKVCR